MPRKTKEVSTVPVPIAGNRFLRFPDVVRITGLDKGTIYYLIREGMFPAQVPLGKRAVAFLERDVTAWIESRVAARATHVPEPRPRARKTAADKRVAA